MDSGILKGESGLTVQTSTDRKIIVYWKLRSRFCFSSLFHDGAGTTRNPHRQAINIYFQWCRQQPSAHYASSCSCSSRNFQPPCSKLIRDLQLENKHLYISCYLFIYVQCLYPWSHFDKLQTLFLMTSGLSLVNPSGKIQGFVWACFFD